MARPREFDEEGCWAGRWSVFRAKGFDGTTLDELEQATGLGRGSLYGAFGDKRALFLKALASTSILHCASRWRGCSAPRRAGPRSWPCSAASPATPSAIASARAAWSPTARSSSPTATPISPARPRAASTCSSAASPARSAQAQARGEIARRARPRPPRPLSHRLHGGDAGPGPRPPRCGLARRRRGRRSRRRWAERRFCSCSS